MPERVYPRRRLQCPSKARSHSRGKTCGRREREADAEAGGAILPSFCIATVEGTQVVRMAPPFAGRRRSEGLGRSDSSKGVSSPLDGRADDSGCPLVAEEGNVVGMRVKGACTHRKRLRPPSSIGDASFARSRDPCSSIVTTLLRRKPSEVARSVGYRGRANLRKQEEPAPGSHQADAARLAACPPLPQGRQRGTSEKEGGCGLRPCEETRVRAGARTS
jgi:hypothetical protein